MKKAIITGATGLVGMAVAKYLSKKGVSVLCLGRKQLNDIEINDKFGSKNVDYLPINMDDILSLPEEIIKIGWATSESCVFYNFAWGGDERLTDGDFEDQFKNSIYSPKAVLVAKQMGCSKFVNCGSMEETFAEEFIRNNKNNAQYISSQTDYAISKLASRDMCKMVSYLEKIDYIHTRLSVPLDMQLSKGGYISSVLSKIYDRKTYDKPSNPQLFDIIFTEDVAKAYYLIGLKGKNKADYFIGTSFPKTLKKYFESFEQMIKGEFENNENLDNELFSIETLVKDTGFEITNNFEDIIKTLDRS